VGPSSPSRCRGYGDESGNLNSNLKPEFKAQLKAEGRMREQPLPVQASESESHMILSHRKTSVDSMSNSTGTCDSESRSCPAGIMIELE
jgi:hypothetical protein